MAPWLHQVLRTDNRNGAGVGLEANAPTDDARDDPDVCAGSALVHGPIPRSNDIPSNSTHSNRDWGHDWCLRRLVRT